ncbi:MAG: outer membrane lipoprotein carrier protein LolA [Paludibacteraceae bacterium]|nr:outer membrane lipoprotein carrier protein LolA [Paludibacteraceae bacterium]
MKTLFVILFIGLFDADFVQTRTSDLLVEPQVMTGHIRFEAPENISWQYDGKAEAKLPEPMLNYIRSLIVSEQEHADGWQTISPLPKQLRKMFSEVKILFKDNVAVEVVLTEPTGDKTQINFKNAKVK